jgi:hypothetical protein
VDVAPDKSLNRKVAAFLRAEALEMSPAYTRMEEKLLVESGLLEESPETIIEMKTVLAEYREFKSKKK